MAKKYKPLTAAFVRSVTKPGKYYDSFGLFLQVFPSGAKCWQQRITYNRRRRTLGLGGHRVVTLAMARAAAIENLRLVREGKDPLVAKRRPEVPTFSESAQATVKALSAGWSNPKEESAWMSSFERYVFPRLGSLLVSDIQPSDILEVVSPIWSTKNTMARRMRQRIGAVMKWAMAYGYRMDNPAGEAIMGALPRMSKEKHHAAVPHAEVVHVISLVYASNSWQITKLAFEFLILTAVRSGEVRGARWEEIDLDTAVWTIPAQRMKIRVEHKVPLSARAIEILREARKCTGSTKLVFPSKTGRPLSDVTFSQLMKTLNVKAVPHGFRSSFRDWCGETGMPREVSEACLAHTVGTAVEVAYRRTKFLERRREVMEKWARYLNPEVFDR